MSSQFQIVFRGELLDGFELATVKERAGRRLKAEAEQVDRVFSGKRVVLKKGLTDETAQRYASELQRIGMRVTIEPETVRASGAASASPDPIGAIDPAIASAAPARVESQRVTSRDEPAFDPLKTHLSPITGSEPPSPARWSQPTIAVSQRSLSALQPTEALAPASGSSSDPTLIVPPRPSASSEPTIVVTRGSGSSSSQNSAPNISSSFAPAIKTPERSTSAASEPTMIVPPRHGGSSDATMIVPPRHSAASEPTLIVPPRHSAASEPTMIVPPRTSSASQPTVIVRSNQKLQPTAAPGDAFDAEKTLLSTSESIADYLAAPSDEQLASAISPSTTNKAPEATSEPEVQCPTCGDKQPKRVYCRRCGHALQLPPKQPAPGESTVTITKRPFPRPAVTPPVQAAASSEATVLVEEHAEPETKSAARKGFLAAPTWLTIGFLFVALLAIAGWLIFS